jgi:hypothetical protein
MNPPSTETESGTVECIEIIRAMRHGAMQPLLCRADDGAHYVVKPFSSSGDWPQVMEWICARLGRALDLPIPNYRIVEISEELADAWNATHARQIEAGLGFGSQLIESAVEFTEALLHQLDPASARRLLAFDWWIRNRDRTLKNPNLLWSAAMRGLYVIDHEQAGQTSGVDLFWSLHLGASHATSETPWLPEDFRTEFRRVLLAHRTAIQAELPSTWTSCSGDIDSFFKHLERTLDDSPHTDWRTYD